MGPCPDSLISMLELALRGGPKARNFAARGRGAQTRQCVVVVVGFELFRSHFLCQGKLQTAESGPALPFSHLYHVGFLSTTQRSLLKNLVSFLCSLALWYHTRLTYQILMPHISDRDARTRRRLHRSIRWSWSHKPKTTSTVTGSRAALDLHQLHFVEKWPLCKIRSPRQISTEPWQVSLSNLLVPKSMKASSSATEGVVEKGVPLGRATLDFGCNFVSSYLHHGGSHFHDPHPALAPSKMSRKNVLTPMCVAILSVQTSAKSLPTTP